MKSNSLIMNFTVDKDDNKIKVEREFAAPVEKVWAAWTQSELLDQWWAPKPWKSRTKSMDFREGGSRLYAMVGPNGEEHWGRTDYKNISHLKSFTGEDVFCDEEGNTNEDLPIARFSNEFSKKSAESTLVLIISEYKDSEQLQKLVEMGFKEGLSMAFENLDELLKK